MRLQHLQLILTLAETFKRLHQEGYSYRTFDTGLAISIFRDNSTRTRFSFASAASALGLSLADLDEQKSQVAHGETVRETANMISFLTEVIGIRDDMFLGEGNSYMRAVGDALTDGTAQGVSDGQRRSRRFNHRHFSRDICSLWFGCGCGCRCAAC